MAKTSDSSTGSMIDAPIPLIGLAVSSIVAIPWYWHLLGEQISGRVLYGLPMWALVSILGSLLVSCFTWRLYQNIWPVEASELLRGDSTPVKSDRDPPNGDPPNGDPPNGDPQNGNDRIGEVE